MRTAGGLPASRIVPYFRQARWTLAVCLALLPASETFATSPNRSPFLVPKFQTDPPNGAVDLCVRYKWACSANQTIWRFDKNVLKMVRKVNRNVNRSVRYIEDLRQYGRSEYWTLPTRKGGDCEDIALLKKATLLERGVPPQALLVATVLDNKRRNHAVLVLRTDAGDYVLDSANNRVRLWSNTRYKFLKMQDPNAPDRWQAVLASG